MPVTMRTRLAFVLWYAFIACFGLYADIIYFVIAGAVGAAWAFAMGRGLSKFVDIISVTVVIVCMALGALLSISRLL